MLERFTHAYERYLGLDQRLTPAAAPAADPAAEDEHRAVLELLVATVLADGLVTEAELDGLGAFGADRGWDTPTFSFSQGLGTAVAKVRDAREADPELAGLLADAAGRITSVEARAAAVEGCRHLAASDGTVDDAEGSWIARVASAVR